MSTGFYSYSISLTNTYERILRARRLTKETIKELYLSTISEDDIEEINKSFDIDKPAVYRIIKKETENFVLEITIVEPIFRELTYMLDRNSLIKIYETFLENYYNLLRLLNHEYNGKLNSFSMNINYHRKSRLPLIKE